MDAGTVHKILAVLDRFPVEINSLIAAITVVEIARGLTGATTADLAVFSACEVEARRAEVEGRGVDPAGIGTLVERWAGLTGGDFDRAFETWRQWRREH